MKRLNSETARLIAQHEKPFSDSDFIKQCLTKVVGIMCQEQMQDFNNVSMSKSTVVRRSEDLSVNLQQVSDKACAFDYHSIADDESVNATDTAQLLIFLLELMIIFALRRNYLIFGV